MLLIIQELKNGFHLIFPHKKFRWLSIMLSGVAAGIAISELLVMKLFSQIVLEQSELKKSTFEILLVGFLLFFFITRLGQYFQRNYRVRAIERNFKSANKAGQSKNENAEWIMALELTNLLSYMVQLIAILAFFALLSPLISMVNVFILICILLVLGKIFKNQLILQRKMQESNSKKRSGAAYRHANRVRAGEGGALASGAGMLILLIVLLFLNIDQQISASNTLVIFLGARLQNGVLSNISRSLAKYARSQVVVLGDSDIQ